jgi:DNA-binding transcriptional LysR family regulator
MSRSAKSAEPDVAPKAALAPQLRRVNLDLLPVLHELLRTRSVTRTARAFGHTQPAISRALRQLREIFDDELLVPVGRGARLTPRAEALIEPLRQALGDVDRLLRPQAAFGPATERAHFLISTADYVTVLLSPILTELAAREAPGVSFEFAALPVVTLADLARVDAVLVPRPFGERLGKRVERVPLWQDDTVCIAAARNRRLPKRITPAEFQQARHVGYKMNPRVPARLRALLQPTAALETARVCTVPDFLVLGAIVARADCVALVPRRLAVELVRWRRLRIIEIDFPDSDFTMDACWSPAVAGRRGHAWLRNALVRAARQLG